MNDEMSDEERKAYFEACEKREQDQLKHFYRTRLVAVDVEYERLCDEYDDFFTLLIGVSGLFPIEAQTYQWRAFARLLKSLLLSLNRYEDGTMMDTPELTTAVTQCVTMLRGMDISSRR